MVFEDNSPTELKTVTDTFENSSPTLLFHDQRRGVKFLEKKNSDTARDDRFSASAMCVRARMRHMA